MAAILDLPTELQSFLARSAPQTMLLRGEPGTGKTTLAIALLEHFRGPRFLISGRLTSGELNREFPRISNGGGIHLLDSSDRSGTLEETARIVSRLRELVEDPGKEEILRGLWLPDPIQEAWGQSDGHVPCMVVIDSWDALMERYLGATREGDASTRSERHWAQHSEGRGVPDRKWLERLLLEQMSQGAIFLVLVLERPEPTQLDYLVNAVLETTSEVQTGRPERWLHLRKLRGTEIDSPVYPFTLQGAHFQCIGPVLSSLAAGSLQPEADPGPVPGAIWPGCADFADAFGRLPIGRLTLLERDLSVPMVALLRLIQPIAGVVARQGGRVLHVLPPNSGVDEVLGFYRELLSPEQILRQIRFQPSGSAGDVPPELAETVFPPPAIEDLAVGSRLPEPVRFLRETGQPGTANLAIVWITALRAFAARQSIEYRSDTLTGQVLTYLSGAPAHAIFIGPDDDPLVGTLRTIAATRVLLQSRAGRVFIWGEQPSTPTFVLSAPGKISGRPYELLRIV
jgi:hypothetical protein